jgi:hypothetical protein
MENQKLNSKNFLDYALMHYENPECKDIDEFSEDVNRIKYLKRLFSRYEQDDDFKSRLVVNHLIVFNNVFGVLPSARILFYRVEEKYHPVLKTCLKFLDRLPAEIPEVDLNSIPIEHKVLNMLENEI